MFALVVFSISNACVHYRDKWYRMIEGVPTGGSDSVVIANIYVKWVMLQFNKHPPANHFSSLVTLLLRFIDDILGVGMGLTDNLNNLLKNLTNLEPSMV